MNKKHFITIIAVISIIANIVLVCLVIQPPAAESPIDNKPGNDISQGIGDAEATTQRSLEDEREFQIYAADKPLFYGTWKIVEQVPAELAQPSYISGFNEDGTFRGPNTSVILGEEITFALDYVECSGEKHEYVCRPRTYSQPLSKNAEISYNYAKTLGIVGNYYSIVEFLLPGHNRVVDEPREVKISDIRELYLKDKDTIYANAYHGITYKLERISD